MKPAALALFTLLFAAAPGEAAARRRDKEEAATADPIEAKSQTDFTAFSTPKKHWRLGPTSITYGLIKNGEIGLSPIALAFGLPNLSGKVTAIQSDRIDVSLEAAYFFYDFSRTSQANAAAILVPVGGTGSWTINPKNSLHFGGTWYIARMEGGLTPTQMGAGIEALTGANLSTDLIGALEDNGLGAYADANLTLYMARFAYERRLSDKSSLIFESNRFVSYGGLFASGVSADTESAEVDVGASVRVEASVPKNVPTLTSLSYQRNWERLHLRVGLPLPVTNDYAYTQAFELYWLLGPTVDGGRRRGRSD
jgi:hypothetical protein